MAILVTGANGFVGKILLDKLLNTFPGQQIYNIDLKPVNRKEVNDFTCDITDKDSLKKIILDNDKVSLIHLAANIFTDNVPSRFSRKKFFFDTNVYGTDNLLDVFKDKISSISFLSTDMVYGTPESIPISTSHKLTPNGEYGLSKIEAENLITTYAKSQSIKYFIFRPRLIAGPGRYGLFLKLFYLIKNNFPVPLIGDGTNRYQFISVYDCADALIHSLKPNSVAGIYNLGSENPPNVNRLLNTLIESVGSKSKLVKTSPTLIKNALAFLDLVNLSLLYPEQYLIADKDYLLDTSGLKDKFGFTPKYTDIDMINAAYKDYLNL
ncbi:MAG: NAD(P)-dependent oxidoreductase [SAR86 cluster bacterium]|nr:NAD(P)-dependent oxidoreductase [SAR86 cluster bacterium]